uniref:Uncharacterized protein n=1 Tax=Picea glauca TaxID=3330 RepID=A0A101M2J3_PICGL|nr:hypothetical protein ABT39_MTgene3026 [Picea glauca]QHR91931.1 hypothetical protein Q903MT_gene5967 [Picea sitchensis]
MKVFPIVCVKKRDCSKCISKCSTSELALLGLLISFLHSLKSGNKLFIKKILWSTSRWPYNRCMSSMDWWFWTGKSLN